MSTSTPLLKAYTDTKFELKHIVPLDFNTIHKLPESHEWNDSHDDSSSEKSTFRVNEPAGIFLPVIDLTAPNAVELMETACQKWGMFYVTNHGVPSSLINDVEAHARRLFALPSEQKLKALRSPSGPTGYGAAWISPFFQKLMWHEGFTIMGSAVEHAKELWPQDYQEFCDAMDNYQKNMKSLAHKLLHLIIKSLGVDESSTINISPFFKSDGALQLNSYPPCPNPNQTMGLAPHTDTLFLTILHQNDTHGLQIFQEGVGWTPVPPVPNALLVNMGDLMQILSNSRFRAVYHRVLPNEIKQRISFAYFYGPPIDSIVAPICEVPCFKAVVVKEFISLKNKYLEKAVSMVKI